MSSETSSSPNEPELASPRQRSLRVEPSEAFDWRLIRPYIWLVVLVTIAATALAVAYTMQLPRIYQATCVLEYDPNPQHPLGEGVEDVAEPVSDYWMSHEFIATQNRILSSRSILEAVVSSMGLNHERSFVDDPGSLPADWEGGTVEETAALLQTRLTVSVVDGTRLININVRDRDPQRAALIANRIADVYITRTLDARQGSTATALTWLQSQLDTLRHDLDSSELALHAFKEDHNILSVSLEDRQNLVAGELETYSEALRTARTHRIELRARLTRLRLLRSQGTIDAQAAAFVDISSVETLATNLHTAMAEREVLGLRYGVEHPRIQEADREITSLRSQLEAELDGIIHSAEADLREASEIEAGLQSAVEEANRAGLELNLWEIEYSRLTREQENHSKLYGLVLERTTETQLTQMLRTTHVRPVDLAVAPHRPVSPVMATNAAFGLGAGVVLGLGIALLLSRLDRRVKTVREAEEVGLTVLGVVPRIPAEVAPTPAPASRRRRGEPTKASAADTIVHTHPMSSTAENCRTIRTNLMFMAGDEPLRTLAVTSGSPQEGKTTVAANLAISIAQSGKRVLVVDTDMRRPRLHRAFGLSGRIGLTSILVGDAKIEDAAQESFVPNVHVLACGPIPPNPSELLHRERFQHFVRDARDSYDFVLFDSPPLGPVTDAAVLAPQVDGVLIVVKAQQTTRDSVIAVLRQLSDVGAKIAGGVINGFDPRHSRYETGGAYYYRREGYYYANDNEGDGGSSGSAPPPAPEPPPAK